jgi:hypothetical protein
VILDLPPLLARAAGRLPRRLDARAAAQLGAWGAALVVVVVVGSMLPTARERVRAERVDLKHERARTAEFNRLSTVVRTLGAANILACGQPNIPIGYQSVFAWYMGIKVGLLYVSPGFIAAHPHPLVNMYPISNGWKVFPSHVTPAVAASCSKMNLVFRS